jgi:iron complex outermembrane receptor protein
LPAIKSLTFDLNVQNLFDKFYWQYFYRQVSPTSCRIFAVGSGPFGGLPKSSYACTRQYADGIPGRPFKVFFALTARF